VTRQRVLEIVLALVAVVSIPPSLVHWWFSRPLAAPTAKPSPDQTRFEAAFHEGLQFEQSKQYELAIGKFHEAQLFANRLAEDQRHPSIRICDEHLLNCYTANGQDDLASGAYRRVTLGFIDEGEFLRRNRRFEDARPRFEQAEQRILQMSEPNERDLEVVRKELVEVYWNLQRYSDVDGVYARMIQSVHQPLNDYRSVLGEKYMEIAQMRSRYNDWQGAEKACLQAIEEFDRTLNTYPKSETSSAHTSKLVVMHWLEIAYAREGKTDLALSAAEDAFQANQQMWGSHGMARDISTLALELAKQANDPQLVQQWQQRLNSLPTVPCPVPNIHNPACITPPPFGTSSVPATHTAP
jgi:tetratricopeptide (TPR) repeat protein